MFLGYFGVFMLFAFLSLLAILLAFIFKEAKEPSREDPPNLSACQLLSHSRPLFNLLCNSVCDFLLIALQPTLAVRLGMHFGFSTAQIGLFFFFFGGGGALSMALVMFIPDDWDKRKFTAPAMLLMAVFSFLVGPSSLFQLPNSPTLIGAGILVGGVCRGVCQSLCPTEAVIGGIKAYPNE